MPSPPSKRQQASDERRRRVVKAAAELIGERSDGAFTMQELAERSGVSLATPYNLFGSKAAVLGQVFARQIEGYQQGQPLAEPSVADRLRTAVDRLVSAFETHPTFFRNLWLALGSLSPVEHKELIVPVSDDLLQPLVKGLVRDELIDTQVPEAVITITIVRVFEAHFEQWAAQSSPVTLLRENLLSSLALCLLGVCQERERAGLIALTQRSKSPRARKRN